MNRRAWVALLVVAAGLIGLQSARAQVVVPWASRFTVDTDGDGSVDLLDNAPGVSNNQADTDADGIGDVIDPTPSSSNPNLGDPGLGMFGPYTITAGASAQLDYFMILATPPGGYGHIDMDLGGDNVFDATYFGPLTANLNTITIPASLFVDPLWDLNTPNAPAQYIFQGKAFGPGMSSQNVMITGVIVTPEPAAIAFLSAMPLLARRRRIKRGG